MADMPQAAPVPDKPPLHLRGGYLVVASPEDPIEACFAAPAVRALRNARPQATIALATPQDLAPLWERVGRLDHIVPYARKASPQDVARALQDTGVPFESAVGWEASAPTKAFARMGIQQRFGYRLKKLAPHLTDPLDFTQPFGPPLHRVHYYLNLLEQLGLETMVPSSFRTPSLPDRPEVPRIAIVPGSELGPAYRWPLDRFAEVATGLLEKGLEVLVLGDPAEGPEAAELAARLDGKPPFLGASGGLEPVLEALSGCTALLANDGLLPHLAAHLGLPATVLFGPGNPDVRRPLGRIHRCLDAHVECRSCGKAKCPLDHRCMNELTTKEVTDALAGLVATTP